jgi:Probable Zinc-ribbon domain
VPGQKVKKPRKRHSSSPLGRPMKIGVERPPCVDGHAGRVLLDGYIENRRGTYERPRYKCVPSDGSKPHSFRPILRNQHELHGADRCTHCERKFARVDGAAGGISYEFQIAEIAHTLIRLGQSASYRGIGEELRLRAKKFTGTKVSRQAGTPINYVDAFAPLVLAPHVITAMPPILLLDGLWFRDKLDPNAAARAKLMWPQSSFAIKSSRKAVKVPVKTDSRGRGQIFVAYGQDSPESKPYPLLVRFLGGFDEETWVEFLRSLPPGQPEWVVSDRDGSMLKALDRVWPQGTTWYPSHYHLLKNAADAAREDGFVDGDQVFADLEGLFINAVAGWPAVVAASSRGKKNALVQWLLDNQQLLQDLPLIRHGREGYPRSAGAAETYIRRLKLSLRDRIRFFRNAERLDRLLALMTLEARGLANEKQFTAILRDWFLAHDGGESAADWESNRDPKGVSSIATLIAVADLRAKRAKRARTNASKAVRHRAKQQAYAVARAAAGLPPPPVGVPRATRAAQGSVADQHISDFGWLVAEWHPTLNGTLKPEDVQAGSGERPWWQCHRGTDHVWQAQARSRTIKGTGCPFCAHKAVAASESLAATHPDIAAQWHPTRNGTKTPEQFTYGQHVEIWWQCPKFRTHVFRSRISSRTSMLTGCTPCAIAANKGARPKDKKARPAEILSIGDLLAQHSATDVAG